LRGRLTPPRVFRRNMLPSRTRQSLFSSCRSSEFQRDLNLNDFPSRLPLRRFTDLQSSFGFLAATPSLFAVFLELLFPPSSRNSYVSGVSKLRPIERLVTSFFHLRQAKRNPVRLPTAFGGFSELLPARVHTHAPPPCVLPSPVLRSTLNPIPTHAIQWPFRPFCTTPISPVLLWK